VRPAHIRRQTAHGPASSAFLMSSSSANDSFLISRPAIHSRTRHKPFSLIEAETLKRVASPQLSARNENLPRSEPAFHPLSC
jgi:hypothetical protein